MSPWEKRLERDRKEIRRETKTFDMALDEADIMGMRIDRVFDFEGMACPPVGTYARFVDDFKADPSARRYIMRVGKTPQQTSNGAECVSRLLKTRKETGMCARAKRGSVILERIG